MMPKEGGGRASSRGDIVASKVKKADNCLPLFYFGEALPPKIPSSLFGW